MQLSELIIFIVLSTAILIISRRVVLDPGSHGFFRLLCWECILILLIRNYSYWFRNPWSPAQVVSWLCLLYSLLLIIMGVAAFSKTKKSTELRCDQSLYRFEKTTTLIKSGIYRYIRHPMYGSLLFLAWGIFFKNIQIFTGIFVALSSIFVYITAKKEEKENITYFGDQYIQYKNASRMFIPYVL